MIDDAIKQIAERLKGLRDAMDLTKEEMADTAGISVEQYAEMEDGKTDISVSMLQKIAKEYQVSLDVLMFGQEPKVSRYFITRKGAGVSVERTSAYKYESLASGFNGRQMDAFVVTVDPSHTEGPLTLNTHSGQEFNMVLEGDMELSVAGKSHILHKGDSIYFNSELPHGMRALNNSQVKFLAVII